MRNRKLSCVELETRLTPAINTTALFTGLTTKLNALDASFSAIGPARILPVANQTFSALVEEDNFFGKVHEYFGTVLASPSAGSSATALQEALFDTFANQKYLGDSNQDGEVNRDDVVVETSPTNNNYVTITLNLKRELQASSAIISSFGLGLNSIPINITSSNDVQTRIGYEFQNFQFGLTTGGAFFFNANTSRELTVNLLSTIRPSRTITGTLGLIPIELTDDTVNATQFAATVTLDINNAGKALAPRLTGSFNLDTDLTTDLPGGEQLGLPEIQGDFVGTWLFQNSNLNGSLAKFGKPPAISLINIRLPVGSLLEDVIRPSLKDLETALEPLRPTIEALTKDLQILEDFGFENTSIMDLALNLGIGSTLLPPEVQDIADLALNVFRLSQQADAMIAAIGNLELQMGGFDFFAKGQDLRAVSKYNIAQLNQFGRSLSSLVGRTLGNFTFDSIQQQILNGLTNNATAYSAAQLLLNFINPQRNPNIEFQFPLLNDPKILMKLFLGQDVDLFHFRAKFNVNHRGSFETLPEDVPLFLGVGLELDSSFRVNAVLDFGYDTLGVRRYLQEALTHLGTLPSPSVFKRGLYLNSESHVKAVGVIGIDVAAGFLFVEADANGLVTAVIDIKATNPDGDGKFRLYPDPGTADAQSQYLFTATGYVNWIGQATITGQAFTPFGTVPVTETVYQDRGVLLSIQGGLVNPFSPPDNLALATLVATDGTLLLNVGDRASDRHYLSSENKEIYDVRLAPFESGDLPDGEAVFVSAFGHTQRFSGVRRIQADAGLDDDTIIVHEGITIPVELLGGEGNDHLAAFSSGHVIAVGNLGNDTLEGGSGDNQLYGGSLLTVDNAGNESVDADSGNDDLKGGSGSNELRGGNGNDRLQAGSAEYTLLSGGFGNDILWAGSGDNQLLGGEGNDELNAGDGTAELQGGSGNDTINWSHGQGYIIVDGFIGTDALNIHGTINDDNFDIVREDNSNFFVTAYRATQEIPQFQVQASRIDVLNIRTDRGEDRVNLMDISSTKPPALEVNVDLNTETIDEPNWGRGDEVVFQAADREENLIDIRAENIYKVINGKKDSAPAGGITRLTYDDLILRYQNVGDLLTVRGAEVSDNTYHLYSMVGDTTIEGGFESDHFQVNIQPPANINNSPTNYVGMLSLNDVANDATFTTLELIDESSVWAEITSTQLITARIPQGLEYHFTGPEPADIQVTMNAMANRVAVRSTSNAHTTINTGNGNDRIWVSSDAGKTGLTQLKGHLRNIGGPLTIRSGAGQSSLYVSNYAATTSASTVQISQSQITGFAGHANSQAINYHATGHGTMQLHVQGSNNATLAEHFNVLSGNPILNTNDGPDIVDLSDDTTATVDTGLGRDTVNMSVGRGEDIHSLTIKGARGTADQFNLITEYSTVVRQHSNTLCQVYYNSGLRARYILNGFEQISLSSTVNENFVQALYFNVVGNSASLSTLQDHVNALATGTTRLALTTTVENLIQVRERKIERWYFDFLSLRRANISAVVFNQHAADLLSKTDEQVIAEIFLENANLSPNPDDAEKIAYIQSVYQSLLHRTARSTEIKIAIKKLNAANGIAELVSSLLLGIEYRSAEIKKYYTQWLQYPTAPTNLVASTAKNTAKYPSLRDVRLELEASQRFFAYAH